MKALKTYQQLVIYFFPIITNLGFINIVVVVVRLYWFNKRLKHIGRPYSLMPLLWIANLHEHRLCFDLASVMMLRHVPQRRREMREVILQQLKSSRSLPR